MALKPTLALRWLVMNAPSPMVSFPTPPILQMEWRDEDTGETQWRIVPSAMAGIDQYMDAAKEHFHDVY